LSDKIGIFFDAELFDDEALENTPGRVERMMAEFKEWRDWNELERGQEYLTVTQMIL
jgi:hypothetical protein